MKRLVLGILAHVDAGKTTLSEALLYESGMTAKLGRVDKGNSYLDTHNIERERGITVFSKQAFFSFANTEFTLIDTPGHVDFVAEAERAIAIQDVAILVISATDGVTAHTKTLWNLLSAKGVPTFIFVNKTDLSDRRHSMIMDELRTMLSDGCVDFSSDTSDEFFESVATAEPSLMDEYFDAGIIALQNIKSAIANRKIHPCLFGSALKMKGITELLITLLKYSPDKVFPDNFGARVYKISRDSQGKRLAYLKIEGGSLRTKDMIEHKGGRGEGVEKVEEIRFYSADKYKSVSAAFPGQVVAVLGLSSAYVGEGLGFVLSDSSSLTPVLDYRITLPKSANPYEIYTKLSVLTEEDPTLNISYDSSLSELRISLMGEIQTEVVQKIIKERFGLDVGFDEGRILYRETVAESVIGCGHFEPLKHYAEVHVRIDPLPEGEGIVSGSECSTDTLSLNWQRLVITHIEEKMHRGTLTGYPITDVKITLIAGKAHLKHTEGGDFRQATYRAIRQGLRKAKAVLLEPTFDFVLEVPSENLGRAMTDVTNMHGTTAPPEFFENTAVLRGNAPVKTMRSYAKDVRAYTGGEGKLTLTIGKYAPCHNADEVIKEIGYNPDLDERNTANSVFCKGGAGYAVPWDESDKMMHIKADYIESEKDGEEQSKEPILMTKNAPRDFYENKALDKELMQIFERTYGKIKPRKVSERKVNEAAPEKKKRRASAPEIKNELIIIDGYNFIFAIDELRKASEKDLALSRDLLIRMMCDYTAYRKVQATLVFDGYKREGEGSVEITHDVKVVYTKERQTADSYIEKTTHDLSEKMTVRVITGDLQEQFVVLGAGGFRVSPREFWLELKALILEIRETVYLNNNNIK